MQALTFHGKRTIHFELIPEPVIQQPTDVIVQVELCAICGSDLHPYNERELGLEHGTVMGHEFVGKIVEVGSAVKRFKNNATVFCPFTTNCGWCFYCRKGLTCRCVYGELFGWVKNGCGLPGGQAEFVRVPLAESTLMELPENVTREEGLLLGDVFSTGYYCADMADLNPETVCAVLGCGPVGLMAIAGAREFGAEQIYAIDAIPERLAIAKQFGAFPINYHDQSPQEILHEGTEGRGADAVLEVVGSEEAGRAAFELVRPGGVISTVGVHTEQHLSFSPVEAYDKNITYKIGRCPARHYMEQLLPVVQQRKYDLAAIFTHTLPLSAGIEAYQMFDEKKDGCLKVALVPGEVA